MSNIEWVQHNRVRLALHHLRSGEGLPLLVLHGLGERINGVPPDAAAWPGPIVGLDFTGHGHSTRPRGGGYSCELLMADADCALSTLETSAVFGRGLGAYVALLIAGARPTKVRGAVLADGPGMTGGPTSHTSAVILHAGPAPDADDVAAPDPWALLELTHDIRPADYALTYLRMAFEHSGLAQPVIVSAVGRPAWMAAVVDQPDVPTMRAPTALAAIARAAQATPPATT
jgi:pimeloyl-ACP methyl ester carboxylesterase